RVFFDAQPGSPDFVHWKLTGPFGGLFDINFQDRNTTSLDAGTYVVELTDVAADFPQNGYTFKLWDLPAPTEAPIILVVPVNRALDVPGEVDRYTFTADAGQVVYFDV